VALPRQANLGYFDKFMRQYGQASQPTRAELYRDTTAYSLGAETADQLYQQVYDLLGVARTSPQVYVGAV
jgi:hypothetical protein